MIRLLAIVAAAIAIAAADPIPPEAVAIVFNRNSEDSKKLAEAYAKARAIPEDNLVGLSLPDKDQISRQEFDTQLRSPLAGAFDRRGWWQRRRNAQGVREMTGTRIKVIVCMRGVPVRVFHDDTKPPAGTEPSKEDPQAGLRRMMATASAAVDSELTLLAVDDTLPKGPLDNPYFRKDQEFSDARLPIFLVGRIDGPSFAICHRMIKDAIAVEETGLWGFGVIDIANKSAAADPNGDPWLRTIATDLDHAGIPVLTDRFNGTLPARFPLPETAIYYGWYDWNASGPFAFPKFKFRRGAVAVHIHSFSAAQIRNGGKNWCGPLLARGAAATLGNTYEPFLHLTHHLDIFNDRLMKGHTLIEAAYMAMPALSWQGIVLGDPLYRPFRHLDGSGEKCDDDRVFRALRIARLRWPSDRETRLSELTEAARRMNSGTLFEAIGYEQAEAGQTALAATTFEQAGRVYTEPRDRFRMEMLIAKLDWEAQRKASAISTLRSAKLQFPSLPELPAADAWLKILDPPPPPPKTSQKPGNQ